jgi:hypothetical protein
MRKIKDYLGETLYLSMQGEIVATYQVIKDDVELLYGHEHIKHYLTCEDDNRNNIIFAVDEKNDVKD